MFSTIGILKYQDNYTIYATKFQQQTLYMPKAWVGGEKLSITRMIEILGKQLETLSESSQANYGQELAELTNAMVKLVALLIELIEWRDKEGDAFNEKNPE